MFLQSDVAEGRAAPGLVIDQAGEAASAPRAANHESVIRPRSEAYVSVPYKNRWFWIADTDIRSKYTFGFVMLLFSISDTGVRGACTGRNRACQLVYASRNANSRGLATAKQRARTVK